MEGVGHVCTEEADLARPVPPEKIEGVGNHVRDPRKDNTLALANETVHKGASEVPHDAMLH
eukprot:9262609-Alexandrium_andersonii.AAC.1